jgi:transposase
MTSKDPEFEEKQATIVGLYLDPPDHAFVLSVDETTPIQCNTPTEPDQPMEPGTPQRREVHDERQGTTSLFAALAVHSGEVVGDVRDRHTSHAFLDFLDRLVTEYPTKDLHVIVDHLSTHKANRVDDWLEDHPRVTLHFTPTYASWLNQIELWFRILERRLLDRGFFESLEEQREAILGFIEAYSEDAEPFEWTYTGDPLQTWGGLTERTTRVGVCGGGGQASRTRRWRSMPTYVVSYTRSNPPSVDRRWSTMAASRAWFRTTQTASCPSVRASIRWASASASMGATVRSVRSA